jgi:maleate cis-trans isomerase
MYGNLGRIGVITLATDTSVHPEIQRLMPEGVHTYPAPILLPRGEVNAQALAEMLETDSLENAASILTWTGAKQFCLLAQPAAWFTALVGIKN